MKNMGFISVAACVPEIRVADCDWNADQIIKLAKKAAEGDGDNLGADIAVFPELCVTGYTCGDLFGTSTLIESAWNALMKICVASADLDTALIVGAPILGANHKLYNCAVMISRGQIDAAVPKKYIPNYGEFYEKRWFEESLSIADYNGIEIMPDRIFTLDEVNIGIEVCEDLWAPIPPSSEQSIFGSSDITFNLSASNQLVGKTDYLRSLVLSQSARIIGGYVYVSAGAGESTTDLFFGGHAFIAQNGKMIAERDEDENYFEGSITRGLIDVELLRSQRQKNTSYCYNNGNINFQPNMFSRNECYGYLHNKYYDVEKLKKSIGKEHADPMPFVPSNEAEKNKRCKEIFKIQAGGLATRLRNTGIKKMVVGVSGGLDSTLALLVAARAADMLGIERKNIIGITMPGFGTTDRTYTNAVNLIKELGADFREISIKDACIQHFKDINHDEAKKDTTYENSQARERTQILMDVSNQEGGLVVGTGDLSELALGWATYNGDQMSMYGVNAGVPKTLVRYLVKWVADQSKEENVKNTLSDIVDTPVSPELLPADNDGKIAQKTEDLVGPYELHDFFLYHFVRNGFGAKKILFLAECAFDGKYDKETIEKWLRTFIKRFFAQQFKRSAMPDGVKVGSVSLSPRGDWRMPSDASSAIWLKELD